MEKNKADKHIARMKTPPLDPRLLDAEPENIEIDLKRLAVVSADMLNAFATKGAFHDLLGWDLTEAQKTIQPNE